MHISTTEELENQRRDVGLLFLVHDGVSEEVIIDRTPYLSKGYRESGEVELLTAEEQKVTFGVELGKPISGVELMTVPKEGTEIKPLPRVENPTLEQIREAIADFNEVAREKDYEAFEYEVSNSLNFLPGIGEVKFIEDFGGEGQGDHAHVVFEIAGKTYKIDGYYNSWEGTEWNEEAYEVEPVQVTKTEYRAL